MGGRPDLATSYSIPIPDLRYKVPSLKQNEIPIFSITVQYSLHCTQHHSIAP